MASAQGMIRFVDKALENCQGLGVVLDVRLDGVWSHGKVLDSI